MRYAISIILLCSVVLAEENVPTKEEILDRIASQEQARIKADIELRKQNAFADIVRNSAMLRFYPDAPLKTISNLTETNKKLRASFTFDEEEIQKSVKVEVDRLFKSAIMGSERNIADGIKSLEMFKNTGGVGSQVLQTLQDEIKSSEETVAEYQRDKTVPPETLKDAQKRLFDLKKSLAETLERGKKSLIEKSNAIELEKIKLAALKKRYAEESVK